MLPLGRQFKGSDLSVTRLTEQCTRQETVCPRRRDYAGLFYVFVVFAIFLYDEERGKGRCQKDSH